MTETEIVRFYNSIKDQSWPDIKNYFDFLNLENWIKDECYDRHMLRNRLTEICDLDYWSNIVTEILVYENLAFVPVQKCGSSHYKKVFLDMGWKTVRLSEVDKSSTHFFGFLMHPLKRRLKGLTQLLVQSYDPAVEVPQYNHYELDADEIDFAQIFKLLDTPGFKNFISNVYVGDEHSMSYTTTFGSFFYDVNWMPIDLLSDQQQAQAIANFCNLHGHNIVVPLLDSKKNTSSEQKLKVYQAIDTMFNENEYSKYSVYKIYGNDLKYFYQLVENFSIDWKHINHQL